MKMHEDILRVENLSRIYGQGENEVCALDHVSFSVRKGEFVSVIGASGSGKSTLLHLIGGVDRPTGADSGGKYDASCIDGRTGSQSKKSGRAFGYPETERQKRVSSRTAFRRPAAESIYWARPYECSGSGSCRRTHRES